MKLRKFFLILITNTMSKPSITPNLINMNYMNNHNLFEVVIPIKMIDNSLSFYLPNNLKKEDERIISNFITENKHVKNSNNQIFYKISFSKNYKESSLEKIVLYEDVDDNIRNINTYIKNKINYKTPNNNINYSNNNSKKIVEKNKKHPHILIFKLNYGNKKEIIKELNLTAGDHMLEILKNIDTYINKKHNSKNYSYIIYYDNKNKKILGVNTFNETFNEFLNVLYTHKKSKYLIVNKNFQDINERVIGIYKQEPAEKALEKLRSPFGVRTDPFTKQKRMHRGQDISVPLNTHITAVEDGVIVDAGFNKSYGYFIIVHHGYNTRDSYSSVYCHLNSILLKVGSKVLKGEVIGLSGSTGRSSGPHLHFEWVSNQDGNRINPVKVYYQNKRVNSFFQRQIIKINKFIKEIAILHHS